jgi:7,8-dihydroneopterin aldolase/epimerase/oxygenase
MDTILIRGLEFYGYHGASDEEQVVGHRFIVDTDLTVDTHAAGASDDLEETVSYAAVAEWILAIGTGTKYRLIEALCAHVVREIFAHFARVTTVRLRVQKLCPPMNAIVASVGVEIVRDRPAS